MRPRQLRLVVAADRADDCRAEMLRPLTGDESDTAGGGMQQDSVPSLDRIDAPQEVLRGAALEHHGGRLLVGDPVREPDEPGRIDHPLFGIAAQAHAIGHPVADAHLRHRVTHRLHDTGAFVTDDGRHRRDRVQPGAVIHVDEIEPDRRLPDQRLSCARCPGVHLVPAQHFGSTVLVNTNRSRHVSAPGLLQPPIGLYGMRPQSAPRRGHRNHTAVSRTAPRHEALRTRRNLPVGEAPRKKAGDKPGSFGHTVTA